MYKKFLFLGALFIFLTVNSQEDKTANMNTLFKEGSIKKLRGYGGPLVEYSKFINQNALFVGGKGGVILRDKWGFGLILKGKTNRNNFTTDYKGKQQEMRISTGFGGLFVEYYTCCINKVIHWNFFSNFLVGRSNVSIKKETVDKDGDKDTKSERIGSTNFFGIEPGFGIEVNVTKSFLLNLHFGYRYVVPTRSLLDFENTDFNGVSFGIDFKFGRF